MSALQRTVRVRTLSPTTGQRSLPTTPFPAHQVGMLIDASPLPIVDTAMTLSRRFRQARREMPPTEAAPRRLRWQETRLFLCVSDDREASSLCARGRVHFHHGLLAEG